jgi:hypothetical protein
MEENKFKKLVQNIGLDDPGISFTDNVMNVIESGEELSLNPVLLSVLKTELLAEPSFEFPDNLMAKIQPKANKSLAPIISKKTSLIILGLLILILFLVMINFHSDLNNLQHGSYLSRFNLNLSGTTRGIIKIATSILPYLIPLSILLFLDYFFRTRQRHIISRE